MSTRRLRLVVSYDGTDFCGWAAQPGQRTVQGTLRDTVRQVSGEDCEIIGASRTDSGAHAIGQVCHFDTRASIPTAGWQRLFNDHLPRDLAVVGVREVPRWFHSRFWARDRRYRYRILIGARDPLRERYAHWRPLKLDLQTMSRAAGRLIGSHDFRAFSEETPPEANCVRRIEAVDLRENGREIVLEVRGLAFLRGMMRRMAGGLVEVGNGRRSVEDFWGLLGQARYDLDWPVVLPACGLTLVEVRYGRRPGPQVRMDGTDEQNDE